MPSPSARPGTDKGWEAVSTEIPCSSRQLFVQDAQQLSTASWKFRRLAVILTVLSVFAAGVFIASFVHRGQLPKAAVKDVESAWWFMPWGGQHDAQHDESNDEMHNEQQGSIKLPKNFHDGVYIENMNIDVSSQKGITANIHAGVDFHNDMSNTLHNNNDAMSEDGDVKRLNGAYDNNAEASQGDVTRANGAMDNNALSVYGDVNRQNGLQMTGDGSSILDAVLKKKLCKSARPVRMIARKLTAEDNDAQRLRACCRELQDGGSQTSDSSGGDNSEHVLDWLSQMNASAGEERQNSIQHFLQLLFQARNSTKADKQHTMRNLLAWFYGMKQAKSEERQENIARVLKFLYGPRDTANGSYSSVDEDGDRLFYNFVHKMLAKEVGALLMNNKMVNDIIDHLSSPTLAKQFAVDVQSSGDQQSDESHNDTAAEIGEILSSIENAESSKRGPVVIKNVNIKVRHQTGFQANLGAGVHFVNDMSGSLHDNNNAMSKHANVYRINGAYDNNARTANGSVLRVNGAFDNNARSKNGSVMRQNGIQR